MSFSPLRDSLLVSFGLTDEGVVQNHAGWFGLGMGQDGGGSQARSRGQALGPGSLVGGRSQGAGRGLVFFSGTAKESMPLIPKGNHPIRLGVEHSPTFSLRGRGKLSVTGITRNQL